MVCQVDAISGRVLPSRLGQQLHEALRQRSHDCALANASSDQVRSIMAKVKQDAIRAEQIKPSKHQQAHGVGARPQHRKAKQAGRAASAGVRRWRRA